MDSKWIDKIAVIFFVLLVGVFFRQTIFEGKLPVPSDALVGLYHPWRDLYSKDYPRGVPFKNFLITDPVRQQIPWRKIAIDQWKKGTIPSWNPYNFSGSPILANIQAAALYPLNILFLIFPFIDAWTMLIMLQPLLAGLFMYWYLRSLKLRYIASLLGAIAWSFSGFNVAWLTWGTMGHVALWLPLALLSIDKSWYFLLIFSLLFQSFAGHAQISLYFMIVVFAYAVFRKALGMRLILVLGLVVLITSVQWLPLWSWLQESGRIIGTDWHKEGWFIPWAHLVQFVAPDFFGNPTTLNYWGQWNYGEFIGYIGLLPLIFAIIALFAGMDRVRIFWVMTLAVGLVFALSTPIAFLPFILKIPILSALQPTRLIFVIDFALAVLAALGCHTFFENGKKGLKRIPIVVLSIVLAILWIISVRFSLEVSQRNLVLPTVLYVVSVPLFFIFKRSIHATMFGNIVALAIIGIVGVDLIRFGWKFTPFTPRDYFFSETKVLSFLKQQLRPFRIMSVDKRILPPNTASYFGIESIEGYDPIISLRYEELIAAIARGKPDIKPPFGFNRIVSLESPDGSLVPLLSARYVLSLTDLPQKYLVKVFKEGETRVYEDSRAVPRVYVVERPIISSGKQDSINALYNIKDFRHEAVVEGDVSIFSVPIGSDESASLTRYESNRLEIVTTLSVPRLLVVANAYHPGWRATVDGKTTSIYRTNYAFQGIVVPAGTHKIEFSYSLLK